MVQSAKEIQTRFGGEVPEDESALKDITGIGPVFANILATINTRAVHKARRKLQVDSQQE
jgi:adenine-specific DNA glycosylase